MQTVSCKNYRKDYNLVTCYFSEISKKNLQNKLKHISSVVTDKRLSDRDTCADSSKQLFQDS